MRRVTASTLTEVIVALVIITLISALFFAIVIRVGNYHKNRQLLIINQKMLELVAETRELGYLEDEYLEFDGFTVQKTLTPYKSIPGMWEVTLTAFNLNEQEIDSHKAIINELPQELYP
jgi:hypothetical protein